MIVIRGSARYYAERPVVAIRPAQETTKTDMCGICGIVELERGEVARESLLAMRESLRHRGPDDCGLWVSPDNRVGLAHRRLSIIDLGALARQPMVSPDNNLVVVFNGEIYNFMDLRSELQQMGHRFASRSDTEVLLAAFRQWGIDAIHRLDGMFAFAIYDHAKRRLVLARDRAGKKPLYYLRTGRVLRFASELKAILESPQVPRQIDALALEEYLAYGYVPGDMCMIKGVRKLPPGHLAIHDLDTGAFELRQYWSLPTAPVPQSSDEDSLVDELHGLLRESVRRRLVADVPVGILLSGGLDSSLVTAVAAEVSASPPKTFNIAFPGHGAYDESPYAREVANHFGTQHTELVAEPASVSLLPELAAQYDEPMADSSMVPTYMVCNLIRQHAKVGLGGDGGDELFGGYPFHRLIQKFAPLRMLPRPVLSLARLLAGAILPPGRFGRNAALVALSGLAQAIAQVNKYFDPPHRTALLAPHLRKRTPEHMLAPEARRLANQQPFQSPLGRISAMDFRTYLADDILVKVDRASMLAGLEVRAPLLDTRIIEFAYSRLSDDLRATSTEGKVLLRRLGQRLLPAKLDLKRKQGFELPLQQWFTGSWGSFCQDVLSEASEDIFDRQALGRLITQQKMGRRHTQRLFALTMFELWRRHYNVQPPDPKEPS
jgi:asparagine synthase (glutamine-hydrolysing)